MENDSLSIEQPNQDAPRPKPKASPLSMPRILINAPMEPKQAKWKPGGDTKAPPEDLKEFPTWGLPEDVRLMIQSVADGYQCDPSIVTASTFAAAGAALGKSIVGVSDNYRNYPANWFVIVGKASSGKSAPLDWIFRPLMDYDAEAYKAYQAARVQYQAEAKEGRGEPPRLRSRIAANITDEKLLYKLAENNGALCWKHDEFASLLGGLGKYSNGGASMIVGNLLSIFSGGDFTKESVSGEALFIPSPALNIITTTQPSVLKKLMAPYLDNGFFERFLYVNIVGKVPEYKPVIISDETRRKWTERLDGLIRNDVAEIEEHQAAYNIHVAAMNRWREEERAMMEGNTSDVFEEVCCSILEKANYHLCRLSIIAARINGDNMITAPIMQYSVDCVDYLINGQKSALLKILHDDKRAEPTKAETIRQLFRHYPVLTEKKRKSAFARLLGVSQEYITKVTNSG